MANSIKSCANMMKIDNIPANLYLQKLSRHDVCHFLATLPRWITAKMINRCWLLRLLWSDVAQNPPLWCVNCHMGWHMPPDTCEHTPP